MGEASGGGRGDGEGNGDRAQGRGRGREQGAGQSTERRGAEKGMKTGPGALKGGSVRESGAPPSRERPLTFLPRAGTEPTGSKILEEEVGGFLARRQNRAPRVQPGLPQAHPQPLQVSPEALKSSCASRCHQFLFLW